MNGPCTAIFALVSGNGPEHETTRTVEFASVEDFLRQLHRPQPGPLKTFVDRQAQPVVINLRELLWIRLLW